MRLNNVVSLKGRSPAEPSPNAADGVVVKAWEILTSYLPPDSEMSAQDCIGQLLELLESGEAVAILERHVGLSR